MKFSDWLETTFSLKQKRWHCLWWCTLSDPTLHRTRVLFTYPSSPAVRKSTRVDLSAWYGLTFFCLDSGSPNLESMAQRNRKNRNANALHLKKEKGNRQTEPSRGRACMGQVKTTRWHAGVETIARPECGGLEEGNNTVGTLQVYG